MFSYLRNSGNSNSKKQEVGEKISDPKKELDNGAEETEIVKNESSINDSEIHIMRQENDRLKKQNNELNLKLKNYEKILEYKVLDAKVEVIREIKQCHTENFFLKHNNLSELIGLLEKPRDFSNLYEHKKSIWFQNHINATLLKIYQQNDCFLLDIQELNSEFRLDFIVLKGGVFKIII
jgi:hypothetical protein